MIEIRDLYKKFTLSTRRKNALDFMVNFFSKNKSKKDFWALKNINLKLDKGDVLGVIGKNGSGKSTLLKIISGIFYPTSGFINIEKKVLYISGFSNAINKNLTMIDNIYLIGTLNGLSRKEINKKIEQIVDFSDLKDFLFVGLDRFSTGMISRLAFSATMFTLPDNPEILLLDEALGGGADESFVKKSSLEIKKYIEKSDISIIVSHNLNYISENCNKVLWLKDGEVFMFGEPKLIIEEYSQFVK